jgi:signal transduction histidine kinase
MPRAAVATVARRFSALAALLVCGWHAVATAAEEPALPPQPEPLTNLFQLRTCAEQRLGIVRPFRIVAEVCAADCSRDVLVLRDSTGLEFIRLDLKGRAIPPGATVALEGNGCGLRPRGFGLAVTPGVVVDNDGLHPIQLQSGAVLLHAGVNPIRLLWFNGPKDLALSLEYEGPDLPRQRIPSSVLSRVRQDAATASTNFSAGLDYRCYEGGWDSLPDPMRLQPVKTGIATNFDLGVRTRDQGVALEFSGFITIPRDGLYEFYLASDDGSRLWVGDISLEVRVLDQRPPAPVVEQVPASASERNRRPFVSMEGIVNFLGLRGAGGELQMRVGNDDIRVDVFESGNSTPNLPPRARVKVSGFYEDVVNEDGSTAPGVLLAANWEAVVLAPRGETLSTRAIGARKTATDLVAEAPAGSNATPAIVNVAEIKTLSHELAEQQIPVSIRGVLTTFVPQYNGAVLQDSTRGIYVYLNEAKKSELPLQRGEFYQIDGVTGPGLFAPVIVARRITHLGSGQWPRALRATWAQLVNGSLDTQFVEIDGVVTAVQESHLSLLTEGGKITLNLADFPPETLAAYADCVVRIRGCVFAPFDTHTRELAAGTPMVPDAAVSILQPPPRDLFEAPQKSIGELLLYDPEAAPFRRLKISGQIVHGRAREYFLTEGTNGVRLTTRNSESFAVGDLVEAVGFLGLGGPAPELKEAVMRKKGRALLPTPTKLAPDQLLLARYAGTRVQVEATLMNEWREGSDQVLELESRFLAFRARLNTGGRSVPLPSSGSRLELTGVYTPLGSRADDGTVSSFELLLDSPKSLWVLATPSWWNLKRGLALAGVLAALLCAALVWNKALHRQVQERSRQLEAEIRHRERAEQQRAAETERARIARDLHDELGAGLTEVSLLASAGLAEFRGMEQSNTRFRTIAEKARGLVSGLDVIVWAIDPRRNSLQSFADYVGSYAEELLCASNIVCRFRIPIECGSVTLPGAARHSLFLAVKEALNNVIRHAAATEVELRMTQVDHRLEIVIADNGRGFFSGTVRHGNGLANLQERLGALQGECNIESQAGRGTTVTLVVPVPTEADGASPEPPPGARTAQSAGGSTPEHPRPSGGESAADVAADRNVRATEKEAPLVPTPAPEPKGIP